MLIHNEIIRHRLFFRSLLIRWSWSQLVHSTAKSVSLYHLMHANWIFFKENIVFANSYAQICEWIWWRFFQTSIKRTFDPFALPSWSMCNRTTHKNVTQRGTVYPISYAINFVYFSYLCEKDHNQKRFILWLFNLKNEWKKCAKPWKVCSSNGTQWKFEAMQLCSQTIYDSGSHTHSEVTHSPYIDGNSLLPLYAICRRNSDDNNIMSAINMQHACYLYIKN